MRVVLPAILAIGMLALIAVWQRPVPVPFGFSANTAAAEQTLERRFLEMPSADQIRDEHRVFTGKPHMAGTGRDRELMELTRDRFIAFGLDDVEVTTHEVLLPWPEEVTVEMVSPTRWRASMREDPVAEDPDTQIPPAEAGIVCLLNPRVNRIRCSNRLQAFHHRADRRAHRHLARSEWCRASAAPCFSCAPRISEILSARARSVQSKPTGLLSCGQSGGRLISLAENT